MSETGRTRVSWPRHRRRSPWRRLKLFARRYRATTLLVSLVLLVLLGPGFAEGGFIFSVLWTVVLATGIYAVSRKPWTFRLAVVLGIPALAGPWVNWATDSVWAGAAAMAWVALFYAFLLVMVFGRVVRSRVVTVDTVMGGACGYFLIAMAYSTLYRMLLLFDPRAIAHAAAPGGWAGPADIGYFSFVTLTTLGYGDMAPVNPHARSLAALEAATGVLYVATLIAWLVSSFRTQQS